MMETLQLRKKRRKRGGEEREEKKKRKGKKGKDEARELEEDCFDGKSLRFIPSSSICWLHYLGKVNPSRVLVS